MVLIRVPKPWQLSKQAITSETAFFNRRRFLKNMVGAGIGAATLPLLGCQPMFGREQQEADIDPKLAATLKTKSLGQFRRNPAFEQVDRPITNQVFASSHNNFYEFGSTKSIWEKAQLLPSESWQLEVSGLVNNPRTYDLDDLQKKFPLEERVYRFRCVEAWAMVVPWLGFPMRRLLEDVDPTAEAKFVRFVSFHDPKLGGGPVWPPSSSLPWPYTEGLRIEEMANDLAFFAVGIYGRALPKQHGAPIRMVMPWKYGFKGAKSIVKIEFLDQQPATYWNTLIPNEYDFEANVNPYIPHPRWSQAEERIVGAGPAFSWEIQPTLLYNGYEEYVGDLYDI
ncbi:MAG: protein-methionine-sulfoxide reductase catalytic subunit MsrP [Cyanothece sp. SIO1E1]|nr:protein-methionine-sulfoxide reductase catalytic subunit MsrP [Cyanothece sp. SIO1E1]